MGVDFRRTKSRSLAALGMTILGLGLGGMLLTPKERASGLGLSYKAGSRTRPHRSKDRPLQGRDWKPAVREMGKEWI
jgi:hypothetical protein